MKTSLEFGFQYSYADNPAGIIVPVSLSIAGHHVRTFACVDPGTAFCIFSYENGRDLGLDIETGIPKRMSSLAGTLDTFGHEVTLNTLEISFQSTLYFAKYPGVPRNLLGRTGWLDRMRVGVIHPENMLYYDYYDR